MDLSKTKFPERFQAIIRLMVLVVALLFAKVVSAQVQPLTATQAPAGPLALALPLTLSLPSSSPNLVDSLDDYARNAFLPAKKYNWTWQQSALLRAMTAQYDQQIGPNPEVYLNYVRTAINKAGKQGIRLESIRWADAKPVLDPAKPVTQQSLAKVSASALWSGGREPMEADVRFDHLELALARSDPHLLCGLISEAARSTVARTRK